LSGRTAGNTVASFTGPAEWLGHLIPVRVTRAGPYSLWGDAVLDTMRTEA
jgi:hypothetical protein